MTNEKLVTKWLEENTTGLSWTRVGNDTPAVKLDRLYINRSEAYEIRDFILRYYKECKLKHKAENYAITYKKIKSYKASEKVKSDEMLEYLSGLLQK
ncbi:hypothetical protein [Pseudoalteromonas sp. ASV78]|uniref:hypothetical protein n=1 Tax=Pseudoalteromonas sp. ASV78 TaxID=3397851 RepID=UPI0039FBDED7